MSLYQRLGGSGAINAVVDKFYQLMVTDQRVAHYYKSVDLNKLINRQKQFITLISGGPNSYEGTDMKSAHCKHSIGHFEFNATWENLETALLFFKVSQKEINELKQLFYSLESQIVNKSQKTSDKLESEIPSNECKQVLDLKQDCNTFSIEASNENLIITNPSNQTSVDQNKNCLQKLEMKKLNNQFSDVSPQMAMKLKEYKKFQQKIPECEKRKLKQQIIAKQQQIQEEKKLKNCPYQKTYY